MNSILKIVIPFCFLILLLFGCQKNEIPELNKKFLTINFADGIDREELKIIDKARSRILKASTVINGQHKLPDCTSSKLAISEELYRYIRLNIHYLNYKIEQDGYYLQNRKLIKADDTEIHLKAGKDKMHLTVITANEGFDNLDNNSGGGGGYLITELFEHATDWYKVYEEGGYTIWEYTNTTYAYEVRYSYIDAPNVYNYYDNYYVYYSVGGSFSAGSLPALPKVIIDHSFKDTKAECIYNKIKDTGLMKELLKEFTGSDIYDVTYKVVPRLERPGNEDAYGTTSSETNKWEIKINSYYFDKNVPVFIAKTIMHETIHAALKQKVASAGGLDGLNPDNFEDLFRYYTHYGDDYEHKYMARHYVPVLAKTLAELDNSRYTMDYYEAISWSGLWESYEWKSMTQAERNAIYNRIEEFNRGEKSCE